MSIILLAVGAIFNGDNKTLNAIIKFAALDLGIIYDIVIIGRILR